MSKRKAGVNDIIYELDNDDIELSSEDEVEAKIHRLEKPKPNTRHEERNAIKLENEIEVTNLDSTIEGDCVIVPATKTQNGGKTSDDEVSVIAPSFEYSKPEISKQTDDVDSIKKISDCSKTTIYNEDIVIDSPASYSDLGVVGCENRTPLVTIRFKDKKMAKSCKEKVKAFMLSLIKLHDEENLTGSENETDLEVDIWPEDIQEKIEEPVSQEVEEADNLFFVDTAPGDGIETMTEVPIYSQNATMISNMPIKEPAPFSLQRRGPTCFNCDGAHALRDCTLPRNNMKIAENRKNMVKTGRYHVEDDQKYGHLIPGRISGQLRNALGLKRHELPIFTYRMRLLGYPPGWLEEARISHSGITMFDSSGQAILDPEEEEGEVCEPGCKDKFDIKKILDFPGFNVPASSRYKEEAHLFGLPPMSEQDSKMAMLQMLAPNAMKAYKRKKLAMFPSASNNNSLQEGQTEMDLDSGDETAEFPSVPPLPDEAPPPPPPPPPAPPASPPPASPPPAPPGVDDKSADELEVIEVIQVNDIPVPEDDVITIDVDADEPAPSQPRGGRQSPTLDDLEEKKRRLLDALNGDVIELDMSASDAGETDTETENKPNNETADINNDTADDKASNKDKATEDVAPNKQNSNEDISVDKTEETPVSQTSTPSSDSNATRTPPETGHVKTSPETGHVNTPSETGYVKTPPDTGHVKTSPDTGQVNTPSETGYVKTPPDTGHVKTPPETGHVKTSPETGHVKTPPETGHVKSSEFGTPVMNIASPFTKLPTDVKFAKDICDVINFENLPNSTGKYKQITSLLKKVKSEVDRIQDS